MLGFFVGCCAYKAKTSYTCVVLAMALSEGTPNIRKNICPLECKSLPQEFFFYSCFVFGVCACGLPFFI